MVEVHTYAQSKAQWAKVLETNGATIAVRLCILVMF